MTRHVTAMFELVGQQDGFGCTGSSRPPFYFGMGARAALFLQWRTVWEPAGYLLSILTILRSVGSYAVN